jgi:hypothetical protein
MFARQLGNAAVSRGDTITLGNALNAGVAGRNELSVIPTPRTSTGTLNLGVLAQLGNTNDDSTPRQRPTTVSNGFHLHQRRGITTATRWQRQLV